MIIIKTSNGDVLVNDQQMKMVEHDHANHVVRLIDTSGTIGLHARHPYATIEHVEGIIYTNNAQPTEWKDEGSLVKSLQGIIDRQKYELGFLNEMIKGLQSDLRHYSSNIIQVINYRKEGDMSDETAKRIRDDAETMKASGNRNIWELRVFYDQEHPDSKTAETALIGELNEQLEISFASIRRIEAQLREAVRLKEAYKRGSEQLYARNLWQRIKNKRVNLPSE